MTQDHTATLRIRRPARVTVDERGHSVWAGTVETVELELVSTAELRKLLAGDDDTRKAVRKIAAGEADGVLARDPATGRFEIVSDSELEAMLLEAGDPAAATRRMPAVEPEPEQPGTPTEEELSLVSTQMLRKVLGKDEGGDRQRGKAAAVPRDEGGGFDPYNSS